MECDDLELLVSLGQRLNGSAGACGYTLRELLMRALLRIRDRHGRLVPLLPNRAQAEYARTATGRDIVLKARQLGITTYIAARHFIHTITRPGTLSVQVAHDQKSAEEIFRIVHRFLANLPESLREGALRTSRVNVRQIVFPRLDSEYRVETAADPCAGRGLTIQNLHCRRWARWPGDAAATLASLRAAVPAEGEIVLESTPAGAYGCFYQEWQRTDETGYTRHFLPWWYEESYAIAGATLAEVTSEEAMLMETEGLTEAQVAFRRAKRAEFQKLAAEEFAEDAEKCFLASGECVFDQPIIERRRAQLASAAEERDNGRLLIFFPARAGAQYVMGVDAAGGGTDGDYACAQVIERTTGLQCAEWRGHYPPQELAAAVAALGREYNGALVAVERNNHGHGVLAHLGLGERYDNVYEHGNQAGWLTTSVTRPRMVADFMAALATRPEMFYSPRLLDECRTFVRRADGSAGAAEGAHDDCIMAMAIALAVRNEIEMGRDELRVASIAVIG